MSLSRITSYISPSVPFSLVKPTARGLLHRGRALAQADLDPDAGAVERFAQVLRLGRALRRPADDADLLDALEGLGQQREQVAAAGDDGLLAVGHLDDAGFEHLRGEAHCRSLNMRTDWMSWPGATGRQDGLARRRTAPKRSNDARGARNYKTRAGTRQRALEA